MTAKDLFRKLGFKKIAQNDSDLVYLCENNYTRFYVCFDLSLQIYNLSCERFKEVYDVDFVSTGENPEKAKYHCHSGRWQSYNDYVIDAELHNAIHQQIVELGWIK